MLEEGLELRIVHSGKEEFAGGTYVDGLQGTRAGDVPMRTRRIRTLWRYGMIEKSQQIIFAGYTTY